MIPRFGSSLCDACAMTMDALNVARGACAGAGDAWRACMQPLCMLVAWRLCRCRSVSLLWGLAAGGGRGRRVHGSAAECSYGGTPGAGGGAVPLHESHGRARACPHLRHHWAPGRTHSFMSALASWGHAGTCCRPCLPLLRQWRCWPSEAASCAGSLVVCKALGVCLAHCLRPVAESTQWLWAAVPHQGKKGTTQ